MFKVHCGYTNKGRDRWRKFKTMQGAFDFCDEVFKRTKIVLTIIEV